MCQGYISWGAVVHALPCVPTAAEDMDLCSEQRYWPSLGVLLQNLLCLGAD